MQIKLAIKVHNFRTGSLVYHVKVHPFRKSPYPIQTSQNWQNYRSFSVRLQRKQTVPSLSLQNPDPGDTATLPLLSLYKYRLRRAAASVQQQTPTQAPQLLPVNNRERVVQNTSQYTLINGEGNSADNNSLIYSFVLVRLNNIVQPNHATQSPHMNHVLTSLFVQHHISD